MWRVHNQTDKRQEVWLPDRRLRAWVEPNSTLRLDTPPTRNMVTRQGVRVVHTGDPRTTVLASTPSWTLHNDAPFKVWARWTGGTANDDWFDLDENKSKSTTDYSASTFVDVGYGAELVVGTTSPTGSSPPGSVPNNALRLVTTVDSSSGNITTRVMKTGVAVTTWRVVNNMPGQHVVSYKFHTRAGKELDSDSSLESGDTGSVLDSSDMARNPYPVLNVVSAAEMFVDIPPRAGTYTSGAVTVTNVQNGSEMISTVTALPASLACLDTGVFTNKWIFTVPAIRCGAIPITLYNYYGENSRYTCPENGGSCSPYCESFHFTDPEGLTFYLNDDPSVEPSWFIRRGSQLVFDHPWDAGYDAGCFGRHFSSESQFKVVYQGQTVTGFMKPGIIVSADGQLTATTTCAGTADEDGSTYRTDITYGAPGSDTGGCGGQDPGDRGLTPGIARGPTAGGGSGLGPGSSAGFVSPGPGGPVYHPTIEKFRSFVEHHKTESAIGTGILVVVIIVIIVMAAVFAHKAYKARKSTRT